MRILHTADWHLADRLQHIDRTADLLRAVERIAGYCDQYRVDVLLIAGDLFSELAKPDSLQRTIGELADLFRGFLLRGGTIVALAGNHDNDIFCETLRRAFQLAAPLEARAGDQLPVGRLYLAVRPVHFRLADAAGRQVQFACMPYPTTRRYLAAGAQQAYASFRERCELLQAAYIERLRQFRAQLDAEMPSVLAAHVNVLPAASSDLFRLHPDEDIRITDAVSTTGWNYVALGHMHRPWMVDGRADVRYSGSIERLDIREQTQDKSAVLVELGGGHDRTVTQLLPLQATPFYDVRIRGGRDDLAQLVHRYPAAGHALVRCHIEYRPGEDSLHEILAEVSRIFPRCYERTWRARSRYSPAGEIAPTTIHAEEKPAGTPSCHESPDHARTEDWLVAGGSLSQTVLNYLCHKLQSDPDRDELLALATRLLEEMD